MRAEPAQSQSNTATHAHARPLSCLSLLLLLRARAHQPSAAEQSSGEPAKDCRCARARQQPNRLAYRTPHTARAPTHSTVGVVLVLVLARLASPSVQRSTRCTSRPSLRTNSISIPLAPPSPSILSNMSTTEVETLVIGAGPTGLGAAKRLNQLVSVAERAHQLDSSRADPSLLLLRRTTAHGCSSTPTRRQAASPPPTPPTRASSLTSAATSSFRTTSTLTT